jgi:hypothetical protein
MMGPLGSFCQGTLNTHMLIVSERVTGVPAYT